MTIQKILRVVGWMLIALVSLLLVGVVIAAFGPLADFALKRSPNSSTLKGVDRFKAAAEIRTAILQAVGGMLLVIGAVTAWRQMLISRNQHLLGRRIATTESFAKAIEQLGGSAAISSRLGAVYALDRVADDDSGERQRVAEVLCTFVRDHARTTGNLSPDVFAALTILTQRKWPKGINLTGAKLGSVQLASARLEGACLTDCDLSSALLSGARLFRANLAGADLRQANLCDADLRESDLTGTRLSGAIADSNTRWPQDFIPRDHGILIR